MRVASVPPTVNRNMSSNMNRMAVIAELFSIKQQVNIFALFDQTNLSFGITKFKCSSKLQLKFYNFFYFGRDEKFFFCGTLHNMFQTRA